MPDIIVEIARFAKYVYVCLLESRYQYIGMPWAMIVMLQSMIEEHQSCLNAQDNTSIKR